MTTRRPTAHDAVSGDGKITRELVLATALEIIDRDGADALSMRRLGAALDRDPMILYRHAPGKAALLDGVVETVLAQLRVDPADPDWSAQLRAVVRRGAPFIADPDFADWFDALRVAFVPVCLDGVPKLCRSDALSAQGASAWAAEQGFTLQ